MIRNPLRFFKKLYTPPLDPSKQQVLPHREVPEHIVKPYYYESKGMTDFSSSFQGDPPIHDESSISKMRKAGKIAAGALEVALESVRAGSTTEEIDGVVHNYIINQGAYPTPIYFMGFPKSVCTSVNEVICHGIPDTRVLQNGDYMNIDVTAYFDGVHGDTSDMALVGTGHHPDIIKLIEATRLAVWESIKVCKPGAPISIIGKTCKEVADGYGFGICEEFTGHGVGPHLHMPPPVIHVPNDINVEMKPGMTFTIEPILTMKKKYDLRIWPDGWTVVDINYGPSAQFEHTILITEDGVEVLTKR